MGSKIASSTPKKGTVAEPGLGVPGNGVTMMKLISVCQKVLTMADC